MKICVQNEIWTSYENNYALPILHDNTVLSSFRFDVKALFKHGKITVMVGNNSSEGSNASVRNLDGKSNGDLSHYR